MSLTALFVGDAVVGVAKEIREKIVSGVRVVHYHARNIRGTTTGGWQAGRGDAGARYKSRLPTGTSRAHAREYCDLTAADPRNRPPSHRTKIECSENF